MAIFELLYFLKLLKCVFWLRNRKTGQSLTVYITGSKWPYRPMQAPTAAPQHIWNSICSLVYLKSILYLLHPKSVDDTLGMNGATTLSLEGIAPGDRVRFTEDGLLYAIDLAMIITEKSRRDAEKELQHFATLMYERNITGKGKTKLISFNDANELITGLPSKLTKTARVKFAKLIKRSLSRLWPVPCVMSTGML